MLANKAVRVCIIGSGAGGICAAIELRKRLGLESWTIFEQSHQPGGTWEANVYPGCACDVPSHWYSLSTELNPEWTSVFSDQPEIEKYWRGLVVKHGLQRKTRYSTRFISAVWHEDRQLYTVVFKDLLTKKEYTEEFEVFISAMGGLSVPLDKPTGMTGIEDFQGPVFHSARWRHDVALAGKKVAVIGNGCSASQFVPVISKDKSTEVMNFVRTPNYYMPRPQRNYSSVTKWAFRNIPGVMRTYRNFIATTSDLRFGVWQLNWAPIRHYVEEVSIKHITSSAPAKYHAFLTPRYPFGCKRVIMDPGYLASLHRSNVDMITDPIATITKNGLRGKSGKEYEFDVLILATGFVIDAGEDGLDITGRDGKTLTQQWMKQGGAQAYWGSTVSNFPNFFIMLGPNAGSGHASAVYAIEANVDMMIRLVEPLVKYGVTSMEVKVDAEKVFNENLARRLSKTVFNGGCSGWYVSKSGKNSTMYPGMITEIVRASRSPVLEDFIQIGGTKRLSVSNRLNQLLKLVAFLAMIVGAALYGPEKIKNELVLRAVHLMPRVYQARDYVVSVLHR